MILWSHLREKNDKLSLLIYVGRWYVIVLLRIKVKISFATSQLASLYVKLCYCPLHFYVDKLAPSW